MNTRLSVPTFNDRYVAELEIGRHGMTAVYEGIDHILRRRITLTVLSPQSPADEVAASERYSTANGTLGLDHPNIVVPYDAGRQGGDYYFVSEFVEGKTLAQILAGGERLPENLILSYAAQVGGAIAYAEAKRVQLDAGLQTIHITADGIAKVATDLATPGVTSDRDERFSNAGELIDALRAARTAPLPPVRYADATTFMMDAIADQFSKKSDVRRWEAPAPRRWPVRTLVASALLLLLLAGGIAYAATRFAVLSDYEGMSVTEARANLFDDGYSVAVSHQLSTQVLAGHVIEQAPAAGQWVTKGSDVLLIVSSGQPPVPKPSAAPHRVAQRRAPIAHPTAVPRNVALARPIVAKPTCATGNLVHVAGYPRGCTANAIVSSGELLGGKGVGSTVPVTSLASPGKVSYALAYVTPPSGRKRLVGVLAGNGSGSLIVRVQDGMFVEQNGSHVRYSTFDGERIAAATSATPESAPSPQTSAAVGSAVKCPQTTWLRRTLHNVFNPQPATCR